MVWKKSYFIKNWFQHHLGTKGHNNVIRFICYICLIMKKAITKNMELSSYMAVLCLFDLSEHGRYQMFFPSFHLHLKY